MKAHVSASKKQEVAKLGEMLKEYRIIGIIDLSNYSSSMLQKLKGKFRDKLEVKVSKKSLMKLAFENTEANKHGLKNMVASLDYGIPALVFTNDDPFRLSKLFAKNRTMTFAKAGQIAPNDIMIEAGPTPFAPGPVIGELSSAGLKTAVEGGKIVIKDDKLFVRKDEVIDAKKADILSKLGIEPIEVGVKIIAMFEDGKVYHSDVLEINEEEYIEDLRIAGYEAFNLAFNTAYTNKDTISLLLTKAYLESLALEGNTNKQDDTNGG